MIIDLFYMIVVCDFMASENNIYILLLPYHVSALVLCGIQLFIHVFKVKIIFI